VSRSSEAKLFVKMGDPIHLIQDKIKEHGIRVLSSNYTLYGDLSRRIGEVYEMYSPRVEVYSIDESFLDFDGFPNKEQHARNLVKHVKKLVGIPVRIGLGPTKTLAKCANHLAKKNEIFDRVCDLSDPVMRDYFLPRIPASDIWGIGRATTQKLQGLNINTAAELRDMPLKQARAVGTVVLERTVSELRGHSCLSFDDVEPQRKGMAVTRSSGQPMTDFNMVIEALTAHATRAAEKLRQHGLVTGSLNAFYTTSRFAKNKPQHRASRTTHLTPMSNDTLDLVKAAHRCAEAAWRGPTDRNMMGYAYSKAGIILDDLLPLSERSMTLFDTPSQEREQLMMALDKVNTRFGKKSLVMAGEGFKRRTIMKQNFRSPRYTTRIKDLPIIRL